MSGFPLIDVLNILKNDGGLLRDAQQLSDLLNVPSSIFETYNSQYRMGAISPYDFLRGIISTWQKAQGNSATIDILKEKLTHIGHRDMADALDRKFSSTLDSGTIAKNGNIDEKYHLEAATLTLYFRKSNGPSESTPAQSLTTILPTSSLSDLSLYGSEVMHAGGKSVGFNFVPTLSLSRNQSALQESPFAQSDQLQLQIPTEHLNPFQIKPKSAKEILNEGFNKNKSKPPAEFTPIPTQKTTFPSSFSFSSSFSPPEVIPLAGSGFPRTAETSNPQTHQLKRSTRPPLLVQHRTCVFSTPLTHFNPPTNSPARPIVQHLKTGQQLPRMSSGFEQGRTEDPTSTGNYTAVAVSFGWDIITAYSYKNNKFKQVFSLPNHVCITQSEIMIGDDCAKERDIIKISKIVHDFLMHPKSKPASNDATTTVKTFALVFMKIRNILVTLLHENEIKMLVILPDFACQQLGHVLVKAAQITNLDITLLTNSASILITECESHGAGKIPEHLLIITNDHERGYAVASLFKHSASGSISTVAMDHGWHASGPFSYTIISYRHVLDKVRDRLIPDDTFAIIYTTNRKDLHSILGVTKNVLQIKHVQVCKTNIQERCEFIVKNHIRKTGNVIKWGKLVNMLSLVEQVGTMDRTCVHSDFELASVDMKSVKVAVRNAWEADLKRVASMSNRLKGNLFERLQNCGELQKKEIADVMEKMGECASTKKMQELFDSVGRL